MDQDRNKAWGFSLFGDDLRQEAGGKISLMGMYQQDMIFQGEQVFPFLIPKFVIFVMYYEVKDTIQSDVIFKVTHAAESNVIAEMPILRKDIPPHQGVEPDPNDPENLERIFHVRIPFVLSPFPVTGPGRLRVRAHYGDGTVLKLGSLSIKHMTTEEFQKAVAAVAAQQEPAKAG
jgi:hypothetical protein